jgi:hypothetical protein
MGTAHVDTFARDHLPPRSAWPELRFELPELHYPERLNAASALLGGPQFAERPCVVAENGTWTYADLRARAERVARALVDHRRGEDERFRAAPVANPGAAEQDLPDAPRVRVEIPENIQAVKVDQPETAVAWRTSTRRAFETYLARGYKVEAFYRDGDRCFYGLERLDATD